MTMKAARLHLRLFLEGIEIPVISAVTTSQDNQPAIAQIQIVPTPMARRLMNRTKVDLFFHDLYAFNEASRSRVFYGGEGGGDVQAQRQMAILGPEGQAQADQRALEGETAGETMSSIEVPPDLLRYRLKVTMDVVGITYTKTSTGGRAVILQCASNSSYWDMIAADQKGGMLFGGSRRSTFAGVTQSPFWDLLGGNTAEVFEKLTKSPASFPNLTGFTAGLMNCMEALFGVYYRRTRDGRVIIGANQFLALTEIRLRLLQQIGVAGGNDSPTRLLRRQGFGSIWRPALRGLPRYFGFRHLLNALMPYTFFEHTPVLCPHYTPPTGTYASYANWAGYTTGFLRNSPQWSWIARDADNMRGVANGYLDGDLTDVATIAAENGSVEDPEFDSLPTDIANDVATIRDSAKGIYEGITQRRERDVIYRQVVNGPATDVVQGGTSNPVITVTPDDPDYGQIQDLTDAQRLERGITEVQQFGAEAIRRLEPVAAWAKSIEGVCGEMVSLLAGGTNLPARPDQRINDKLKAIGDLAKKIAEYAMPPPSRTDSDADSEPAHLYCDVLRPDVWFVPPPRSNVIFPDHVVSLQFGRVFGQEPTRLMVKMYDKLLGSSPLFDKWWIAPTAPGLFRQRPVGNSGAARASIKRDLMDHELAGGIIPIFHSMSDREMFLGARVSGFGANNPEMGDDQKRYFQQVTNFLLFKARFAARQLTVECRYNPYLIQGFPALIIDVPPNAIDTELNQSILNTATEALEGLGVEQSAVILDMIRDRTGGHYLGTIKQLTHSANATGESCGTSITFGYAREHNERIEYMGQDIIRASQERSRRQTQRTVARDSAASAQLRRALQQMMQTEYTQREMALAYSQTPNDPGAMASAQALEGSAQSLMVTRTSLEDMADQSMSRVTIELPTRKTSVVFCLDAPTARQGTPASGDEPASDDYIAGQLGPHGLEIIEAMEVTDQYKNSRRRSNTSGVTASDAERNRQSAIELRQAADWARNAGQTQAGWSDTGDDLSGAQQGIARANALDAEAQILEEVSADYEAGWRYEMATLPFISSPRDGRGRAVTSITTDKIGVPVDARSIPQLAGAVGILNNEPYSVILKVYRVVEDASGDPSAQFDLAAEDILRPPWYDNLWCNDLVGGGVYLPLFGTGSIVDPIEVLVPEAMDVFGEPGRARDAVQQVRQEQQTNDEGGLRMAGILAGSTIENAVDWLAHTYAMTRTKGYDTDTFVRNYTWRPIATMFDMYGSGDLELDPDGRKVVNGVEGFHSRAFGPHQNLFGLIPYNDISMFLGIDESDTAASARVDVRARRHAIVMAYSQELLTLRGCASG